MPDFFTNSLPSFVLNLIISYLSGRDIYVNFSRTSRFLHEFIKNSQYLCQEISCRSLGLNLNSLKTSTSLPEKQLISIISNKFIEFTRQKYKEIPFFGYFTDGGIDNDNPEHWVDTAFFKGTWGICTKPGRNFHFKGSLQSELREIAESLRLFHEISQDFQKNHYNYLLNQVESGDFVSYMALDLILKPLVKEIKGYQQKKMQGNLSEDEEDSDEDFEPKSEKTKKKIKKKQKISKKKNGVLTPSNLIDALAVKDKNFEYWRYTRYELFEKLIPGLKTLTKSEVKYQKLQENNSQELIDFNTQACNPQKYAIIKGVEVSRMGVFSCPVKTCMIFAADNDFEVKNNELLSIFSTTFSINDLKAVLQEFSSYLPSVYHTNCPELKSQAIMQKKVSNCDYNIARFVVFSNNYSETKEIIENSPQTSSNLRNSAKAIKAIAWVQFVEKSFLKLKITFDAGKTFGARFVCVKLIDCEDRTHEFGDFDVQTNIDINYVSFFGDVIDFNDQNFSLGN